MSFVALMEHPIRGRMHVPEVKLQEYLEQGFVEIERIVLEQPQKATHVKVIEKIEAKAEPPEEAERKAASKSGKAKK